MSDAPNAIGPPAVEWCEQHFDYLAPEVAQHLDEALSTMRSQCPVARSDAHDGYWIATRYDDVVRVAQDWQAFSSAHGVSVPENPSVAKAIPEHVDPPLHREYKRLINTYFTRQAVARYEHRTRELVTGLIDSFVERGRCDFMSEFARPFPGRAFFELVLNAPADEAARLNELSMKVSLPTSQDRAAASRAMQEWIVGFVAERRMRPSCGDVVDRVLGAEIEGRPITDDEIVAIIHLLILGGLDTTAGALGQFMIRFCREPEIPAVLRERPELVPSAVEELLRLDGPFIAIGRTAMQDVELGNRLIRAGDKVLIYWASADRDDVEFPNPNRFDLDRPANRHVAFGAGPHRCAGSHLARMNLCIAVRQLVERLRDVRLAIDAEPIRFHSALSRSPVSVPIIYSPGPRFGSEPAG
ncbi:MAG: cytochrome P450 [Acidimicrobiia bacterium]